MRTATRLDSIDALRGLAVAAMLFVNDPGSWEHVYWAFDHAAWHGCTPTDLVFPFFLFIVGVSLALSTGARLEQGTPPGQLRGPLLVRAARIVVVGLVLHAVAYWLMHKPHYRPLGVLQRIGIDFAVVGLLALYTTVRTQWLVIGALLLGYGALLLAGGDLSKAGNIASQFDTRILGAWAYEFDPATGLGHEPEGLLSTLPSIATTLLGYRAGSWLRQRRIQALVVSGILLLAAGWASSYAIPFNKNLWTPSFTLWTAGWASLAVALAHWAIDRQGLPAVGRAFGRNAIAAYALSWLLTCVVEGFGWSASIYATGFGWLSGAPLLQSHAYALAWVALFAGVVGVMDRHRVYIKL
ncbi:MAG: heparan-alpha-glucosaminide N-acetyltransferase domain-containing protein [Rhodoferax sp.]